MKRYTATAFGAEVLVEDGDKRSTLNPRFDLRNHSPTGFSWGYEGSGPAQLALALLCDVLRNDDVALGLYQEFKRRFVASLPQGRGFEITRDDVSLVVERIIADRKKKKGAAA